MSPTWLVRADRLLRRLEATGAPHAQLKHHFVGPLRHVVQLRRFLLAVGIALSKPAAEVRRQLPRRLVTGVRPGMEEPAQHQAQPLRKQLGLTAWAEESGASPPLTVTGKLSSPLHTMGNPPSSILSMSHASRCGNAMGRPPLESRTPGSSRGAPFPFHGRYRLCDGPCPQAQARRRRCRVFFAESSFAPCDDDIQGLVFSQQRVFVRLRALWPRPPCAPRGGGDVAQAARKVRSAMHARNRMNTASHPSREAAGHMWMIAGVSDG